MCQNVAACRAVLAHVMSKNGTSSSPEAVNTAHLKASQQPCTPPQLDNYWHLLHKEAPVLRMYAQPTRTWPKSCGPKSCPSCYYPPTRRPSQPASKVQQSFVPKDTLVPPYCAPASSRLYESFAASCAAEYGKMRIMLTPLPFQKARKPSSLVETRHKRVWRVVCHRRFTQRWCGYV